MPPEARWDASTSMVRWGVEGWIGLCCWEWRKAGIRERYSRDWMVRGMWEWRSQVAPERAARRGQTKKRAVVKAGERELIWPIREAKGRGLAR